MKRCTGAVSLIFVLSCFLFVQAVLAMEPGKIIPTQQPGVKPPGITPGPTNPPVTSGGVGVVPKRDFSISDIKFPSVVYEGDPIEFNSSSSLLVQVSYSGFLPSPQCRVKIACSGTTGCPSSLVGELSFTSIQPGQSKWVSLPVYGTNNARWGNFGSCTFEAVVDPDGSCGDTNTANNKRSVNVTVRKKIMGGLTPPANFNATPGEIIVTNQGISQNMTLSWADQSTAEGSFYIEQSVNSSNYSELARVGANETKKVFTANSANNFSMIPEALYTFRIRTCKGQPNQQSLEPCSDWVAAQMLTPRIPQYPTGFQAIALSKTQIKVTWNDVADEWAYWIERRAGNGSYQWFRRFDKNVTSFTDINLQPNTQYCYAVYPVNVFAPNGGPGYTSNCVTTPAQ